MFCQTLRLPDPKILGYSPGSPVAFIQQKSPGIVRANPESIGVLRYGWPLVYSIKKSPCRYSKKFRDAPDTVFAGYPANTKAGYRISGKGGIPDIRPDTWLDNYIFGQVSSKVIKSALKIIDFCKH
jgi:hypothetical protein